MDDLWKCRSARCVPGGKSCGVGRHWQDCVDGNLTWRCRYLRYGPRTRSGGVEFALEGLPRQLRARKVWSRRGAVMRKTWTQGFLGMGGGGPRLLQGRWPFQVAGVMPRLRSEMNHLRRGRNGTIESCRWTPPQKSPSPKDMAKWVTTRESP